MLTAASSGPSRRMRLALRTAAIGAVLFLAVFNLSDYPTTWFDEGSHLHVPQTLVRFGEYADYSSDGFRYYGPTLGVGPTVLLPIAAIYKVFGIGLLQARVVMAVYLVLAVVLFYRFARTLGPPRFALLSVALLLSSPTVGFIETGRQVLGEVPAIAFLVAGLLVWFSAWDCRGGRLALAGVLLGAAAVTKYQNLIVLAPTLLLAWLANTFYYRTARQRVFLVPGVVVAATFAAWQAALIFYLGPSTTAENLVALREASASAAAFSPALMKQAIRQLLSFQTYGGALIVAVSYAATLSIPRTRQSQQWSVLVSLVTFNLSWYAVASIGWPRYAFTGLVIAAPLVARVFLDALARLAPGDPVWRRWTFEAANGLPLAVSTWLLVIVLAGAVTIAVPVVRPPYNAPTQMAEYLDREVPHGAVIETWEPELGALSAHNYHYPPARLLAVAVRHIWLGGPPPGSQYQLNRNSLPPYVVVGAFARWVGLYPPAMLQEDYRVVTTIGGYELYELRSARGAAFAREACSANLAEAFGEGGYPRTEPLAGSDPGHGNPARALCPVLQNKVNECEVFVAHLILFRRTPYRPASFNAVAESAL